MSETTFEIPAVSQLLDGARRRAGITVKQLARMSGIPVATLKLALQGKRYDKGVARAVEPKAELVATLSAVLRISGDELRAVGYDYAAYLLESEAPPAPVVSERPSKAKAVQQGRVKALAEILDVFGDEEVEEAMALRANWRKARTRPGPKTERGGSSEAHVRES